MVVQCIPLLYLILSDHRLQCDVETWRTLCYLSRSNHRPRVMLTAGICCQHYYVYDNQKTSSDADGGINYMMRFIAIIDCDANI